MKIALKRTLGISALAATALAFSACSDSAKSVAEGTGILVSGQFDTAGFSKPVAQKAGSSVGAMAATDYKFYCVSFELTPRAATSSIGSDGSFSLEMPKQVPFGCFVNDSNNVPVATVRVNDSSSSGMSNQSSGSMNLASNVNLGSLAIDFEKGEVEVPYDRIKNAKNNSSGSGIDLTDVHNQSYNISCVTSGNTANDTACASFVQESGHVFLRVLKASNSINGLGVWASKSAFDACGSIDMRTASANGIATEEGGSFSWSQISDAADFSNGGSTCLTRDDGNPSLTDANDYPDGDIKEYYALGKLMADGDGYNLMSHEEDDVSGTCTVYHDTSVMFRPGSGSKLIGSFSMQEGKSGSDCSGVELHSKGTFVVEFTPVADQ